MRFFPQLGGNTPLHLAVENGHSEVVKELLLSQAKLDIKNNVSTAISSAQSCSTACSCWSET